MSPMTKPSLTITRKLKAPVDKVFRAWTTGEALKRWFGPSDDASILVAEVDLRVGGRYRIVLQETSGEKHAVAGVYRVIEANARLVFTWYWESTPERESLVSIHFEPVAGGTQLTLIHEQFADEPARDRHQHGWTGSLDRLDRHLA